MRSELGIGTAALLPSQVAVVPVAKYLHIRGIKSLDDLGEEDCQRIVNWFILVSVNGYFSSQTDTTLDRDLGVMGRGPFPWEKLVQNMSDRKVRTKISLADVQKGQRLNVLRAQGRAYLFLLYVLLARNGAEDWNGTLLKEAAYPFLARHHIFPREFLSDELKLEEPETEEVLINNVGNITFIHKDINSEIEDTPPEKYLRSYLESAKRHFVPVDESLWTAGQYETFLDYRVRQIYSMGKKYFGEIFE